MYVNVIKALKREVGSNRQWFYFTQYDLSDGMRTAMSQHIFQKGLVTVEGQENCVTPYPEH